MAKQTPHRFGGAWTAQKLDVLEGYLTAYTTALQNATFTKGYIDAFAGSGYLEAKRSFPDLSEEEPQELLAGSARRALRVTPRFDGYVFIESHAGRRAELEELKSEFPDQAHAIANTKAIDMWLLFPVGIGVNRLLKRDADIPSAWRDRLTALLGTENWFDEFYRTETRTDLFGEDTRIVKKATTSTIGRYFVNRLKTIFTEVADQPLVLSNSKGSPLYLLCFAAGNPKGAPIALKIATHLLSTKTGWAQDPPQSR